MGLSVAIALVIVFLFDQFSPDATVPVIELHDVGPLTSEGLPAAAGVAIASAALTAAAPWLQRRRRQLGWVLVLGLGFTQFLVTAISFDSLRAIVIGWVAGAAALVILGGPLRRPTGQAIADGLASVGVPLQRLERASVDARGSTPYFGVAADGQKLFVKALGQDQRSADLLFRVYRKLQAKNLGDERPFSSLRRGVEHEALVALAARDAGIRTPRLAGFATAEPNAYVLAYEAIEGRSLDRVDADEMTDDVLAAIWGLVARSAPASHRPPRPAAGQHLPGRRRRGVDDRLRLQRAGRVRPPAGHRRRRAAGVVDRAGGRRREPWRSPTPPSAPTCCGPASTGCTPGRSGEPPERPWPASLGCSTSSAAGRGGHNLTAGRAADQDPQRPSPPRHASPPTTSPSTSRVPRR